MLGSANGNIDYFYKIEEEITQSTTYIELK